jgi:DNA repair exonuclease SbcCD ATPase subunit
MSLIGITALYRVPLLHPSSLSLHPQVETDAKSATGSCVSRINETQQSLRDVQAESSKLSQQLAAANAARAQLQEHVTAAANAGLSPAACAPGCALTVSAAKQRSALDDSRIAACISRLDALERASLAAASSSAVAHDASVARFAAAERSIDALRQEQQQVPPRNRTDFQFHSTAPCLSA